MFHAIPIIMSRKYFFGFRSPQLPFDIRFWTRGFPLEIRSRKAGLPFAIRAHKRELCLQRYVSGWVGPKLSMSKFFEYFLETTFLYVSWYPDHYEPKIFFSDQKNSKSKFFQSFSGNHFCSCFMLPWLLYDFGFLDICLKDIIGIEASLCSAILWGRPSSSLNYRISIAPDQPRLMSYDENMWSSHTRPH